MSFPLRRRVFLFVAVLILGGGALGTGAFVLVLQRTAEREIAARGAALVGSLARAAEQGVAGENLDLLRRAAHVTRADDVRFVVVYSSNWSPLDAVPFERLREPVPAPAVAHFGAGEAPYRLRVGGRFDFFAPVVFSAPGVAPVVIGYARLALSGEPLQRSIRILVLGAALAAIALTLAVATLGTTLADRFVVRPILDLHRDVARFKEGREPEAAAGPAADEIVELREEFRAMRQAVREREERLRESEEHIALLLHSMGEGMYGVDARGSCTFVNPACLRLLGYARPEDLVGRTIHDVIHHTHADGTPYPEAECTIYRAYREGRGHRSDTEVFWRADGSMLPIEFWSYPVQRAGETIGAVVTFVAIGERKRLEAELRESAATLARQNEELTALDRLKDALIRDVTHELKTPVAKQAMQIEMLRRFLGAGCVRTVEETLRAMERSVRRQALVIRNLLDLSRLESGGRKYAIAPLRLDELVQEVLDDYRFHAETAGVVIEADLEPVMALGDREMLWHVVSNLLSNALKFLAEDRRGAIRVAVAREGDAAVVRVADNGIGLTGEELKRAFEKFYQGSASIEGSGVGLPIAQRIVEELGGGISLASPGRGGGATATVTLPLAGAAV